MDGTTLLIQLIFVAERKIENRTGDTDHKLGHLKGLLIGICRVEEGLRINLLRYPMELTEDYSALGEADDAVEGPLSLQDVGQVCCHLFKPKDRVRVQPLITLKLRELEP